MRSSLNTGFNTKSPYKSWLRIMQKLEAQETKLERLENLLIDFGTRLTDLEEAKK